MGVTPVFEADKLSKSYLKGKRIIYALKDACMKIISGEFACITGRSGSGKSTFLNVAGLLDMPSSGTMRFSGMEACFRSSDDAASFRREHIGFVFQKMFLQEHLTAIENVMLPLRYSNRFDEDGRRYACGLLEQLGISDRADFFPSELSGGESQRVAIARALINRPSLILADEPTSELDSESASSVMSIFKEIAKKHSASVIAVTHDLSLLPFCDTVFRIDDGILSLA